MITFANFYFANTNILHNLPIFSPTKDSLRTVAYVLLLYRKFKVAKNLRLSWSGLWLLIMLLSTDVINTSVSILNCPMLKDHSGDKHLVQACMNYGLLFMIIITEMVLRWYSQVLHRSTCTTGHRCNTGLGVWYDIVCIHHDCYIGDY